MISVNDTVQIKSKAHHHPLLLKLMVTNSNRNKYRGAQKADSRVSGNTVSKKELVHSLFSFIKTRWSQSFNCSSTVIS